MQQAIIEKYNVAVPRYTSYPPANHFVQMTEEAYRKGVLLSNDARDGHLSFYFHIPFCRSLCHYCACNSYPMRGEQGLKTYVEALHREIELVVPMIDGGRRISQIHYGGGTPTVLPPSELQSLNDHLLSAFSTISGAEIAIECHPGYLSANDWQGLIAAGFTRMSIGVQDMDEQVLRTVGRRPSREPIEDVVALLHDGGATVNLDFMYGLPGQTAEGFCRSIDKAIAAAPDRLAVFSYAHVPWLKKRQLRLERVGLPSSEEKERMFALAAERLAAAGYVRIGMDHFVRPDDELCAALAEGTLHRNFQGYCTRRTTGQVYAFGVTGISQLETLYAQNTRDIDDYLASVAAGKLPIRRGYVLSREQQVVREVIDTLMCNYQVTLNDEQRSAVNFDERALREMEADGIITLCGNTISMVHESSPFVRNVAALLDPLMKNTDRAYSKPI